MWNRLLRFIVGVITFVTLPVSLILCMIIWIFTAKFYLLPIFNWIGEGEFKFD